MNVLAEAEALFIRRWGEMAASWGISRTMAEIHALLYLTPEPLCTDDIMERLSVSRGSASMNLRQLVNWGLIYRVHQRGDRKEYFQAEKDVWQMFQTILRERKRREVEPIVEAIERCQEMLREREGELSPDHGEDAAAYLERFGGILAFFQQMNMLFNAFMATGPQQIEHLGKWLGAQSDGRSPQAPRTAQAAKRPWPT